MKEKWRKFIVNIKPLMSAEIWLMGKRQKWVFKQAYAKTRSVMQNVMRCLQKERKINMQ